MKTTLRLGLATALVAMFLVPATSASAADPEPPCVHRICLVVVADDVDSDGDGYPDVDEIALGSDPRDATSTPKPQLVIDLAIRGELPSFVEHLTEMVVFPQLTPGLDSYATAIGIVALPGHAWDDMSLLDALGGLEKNGLAEVESILGFASPRAAPVVPGENTWAGYQSLIALGSTGSGGGSFTKTWKIPFRSESDGRGGTTTVEGHGSYQSRGSADDPGGVQADYAMETSKTDAKGGFTSTSTTAYHEHDRSTNSSDTSVTSTTTTKGQDGHVTTTTVNTRVTVKDGVRTQTVHVTVQVDDEVVMDETAETKESCPNNACGEEMSNPDYLEFVLSPADYARVAAKLTSIQTPGPDTGLLDGAEPEIPTRDIYALYSGDGVVVLATEPALFNRAQPEYDPRLRDLAPFAGSSYPLEGTDPYGGPDD